MGKEIFYDEDVLDRIEKGIDQVANTVKMTLGPKGKNVILEKMVKDPQITNDGAYISRELEFDGTEFNTGAEIIKQASIKTSENSGDGTTSSIIVGHEIFKKARKAIGGGSHPTYLKRGIEKALKEALGFVHDFASPLQSREEIEHVASMSAGQDDALGELIGEAIEMVGKDGIIRVEESEGIETYLEFSEGMQIDRGAISHDFFDEGENEIELEEPLMYIADERLTDLQDVLRPMEHAHQENRPLFILAHDVEGEALATLTQNQEENNIDCCAVKAPRVAEKRTEILDNVGVLTNAAVISEQTGVTPQSSDPDVFLGISDEVAITRESTTIIGGEGNKEDIKKQIQSLRTKLDQSGSEHDKEFYQKLISQMSGGLAIIRVGGATEVELKEYKANVEDALSATRSAVKTGILPGGGVTLLELQDHLLDLLEEGEIDFQNMEEERGWEIFAESMDCIFTQLLENGEYRSDAQLYRYKQYREEDDSEIGKVFDVREGEFKDAYESGILEPALVVDDILSNAVSTASSLITSTCMIFGEGEDDDEDDLPS